MPHSMDRLISSYEQRLFRRRLSPLTISGYVAEVRQAVEVLERRLHRPLRVEDLTEDRLQRYLDRLPQAASTVQRKCASLRSFCRFLFRRGVLAQDPGPDLVPPKKPKRLPRFHTIEQCEALCAAPLGAEVPSLMALRDAAILAILWGGGLRACEVSRLDLDQVLFDGGKPGYVALRVRGKGDKERVVPCKPRVAQVLRRYLDRRGDLLQRGSEAGGAVFLTVEGSRLGRTGVYSSVVRYARPLAISASPHSLRHSCATHLLDGGAELRHVQEHLGHADPRTTSQYTHVTLHTMIERCAVHHPMDRGPEAPDSLAVLLAEVGALRAQVRALRAELAPAGPVALAA